MSSFRLISFYLLLAVVGTTAMYAAPDGDGCRRVWAEKGVGGGCECGDGQRKGWGLGGEGWRVRVELRTWPHGPSSVSPLDWFMRWNGTKECLASDEWDNVDNFEIDEVALKFFWERVWGCFLGYAMMGGGGCCESEMKDPVRETGDGHGVSVLSPRQSSQGLSMIAGMFAPRTVAFVFLVWARQFAVDLIVWWIMLMLDSIEAMIGLFYRLFPGL